MTGESLEAVAAQHGHDRAALVFAAMVGGLAISRAIRDVDASGSADILRAVKKQLGLLITEP
jgi:hypothetical protein